MFWLGKAANGCASYSGPSLNLKEFEGLLAQMKLVSEHNGGGQTESGVEEVRGMDLLVSCLCWSAEQAHKTPQLLLFGGEKKGCELRKKVMMQDKI